MILPWFSFQTSGELHAFHGQYLQHNLDASIHGLGIERVEDLSKEKGIKLHQGG